MREEDESHLVLFEAPIQNLNEKWSHRIEFLFELVSIAQLLLPYSSDPKWCIGFGIFSGEFLEKFWEWFEIEPV